jgi:hypothetical protein
MQMKQMLHNMLQNLKQIALVQKCKQKLLLLLKPVALNLQVLEYSLTNQLLIELLYVQKLLRLFALEKLLLVKLV